MNWADRNIAAWCHEHRCNNSDCYILHLKAENARLRKALEEAPEPKCEPTRIGDPLAPVEYLDENYADWFVTTRAEALK